jgi:hypothetical protein
MSNTRTPASGSFFVLDDFAAVARHRGKYRLPGLARVGVALATRATRDNNRQFMMNEEMTTTLVDHV